MRLKLTKPVIAVAAVIIIIAAAGLVNVFIPSQRLGGEFQYGELAPEPALPPPTAAVTTVTQTATATKTTAAAPLAYPTPSERMVIKTGAVSAHRASSSDTRILDTHHP